MKSAVFLLQSVLFAITFGIEFDLRQRVTNDSRRQKWMDQSEREIPDPRKEEVLQESMFHPSMINSSQKKEIHMFEQEAGRDFLSESQGFPPHPLKAREFPIILFDTVSNSSLDVLGDTLTEDTSMPNIFLIDSRVEEVVRRVNVKSNGTDENQIVIYETTTCTTSEDEISLSAVIDFGEEQTAILEALPLPLEASEYVPSYQATTEYLNKESVAQDEKYLNIGLRRYSDSDWKRMARGKSALHSPQIDDHKPDYESISDNPIINEPVETNETESIVYSKDNAYTVNYDLTDSGNEVEGIDSTMEISSQPDLAKMSTGDEQMFLSESLNMTTPSQLQNLVQEVASLPSGNISAFLEENTARLWNWTEESTENIFNATNMRKAEDNVRIQSKATSVLPFFGLGNISDVLENTTNDYNNLTDKNISLSSEGSERLNIALQATKSRVNTTDKYMLSTESPISLPHDVRIFLDVAIKTPNDTVANITEKKPVNESLIPGVGTMAFGLRILSTSANSSVYQKINEPMDTTLDLSSMKIMGNKQNYTLPAKGILDASDKCLSKTNLFLPSKLNEFDSTTCSSLYITRNKTTNLDFSPGTNIWVPGDKPSPSKVILLLPLEVGQLFNLSSPSPLKAEKELSDVGNSSFIGTAEKTNKSISTVSTDQEKKPASSKMLLRLKLKEQISKADEAGKERFEKTDVNKTPKNESEPGFVMLSSGQVMNLANAKSLIKLRLKDMMSVANSSTNSYSWIEPGKKSNDPFLTNNTMMVLLNDASLNKLDLLKPIMTKSLDITGKELSSTDINTTGNKTIKGKPYSVLPSENSTGKNLLLLHIINLMKDETLNKDNVLYDDLVISNSSNSIIQPSLNKGTNENPYAEKSYYASENITKSKLLGDSSNRPGTAFVTYRVKNTNPHSELSQASRSQTLLSSDKFSEDLINMFKKPFVGNLYNKSLSPSSHNKVESDTSIREKATNTPVRYVVADKNVDTPRMSLLDVPNTDPFAARTEATGMNRESKLKNKGTSMDELMGNCRLNGKLPPNKIFVIQFIQLTPKAAASHNLSSMLSKALLNLDDRKGGTTVLQLLSDKKDTSGVTKISDKPIKIVPFVLNDRTKIDIRNKDMKSSVSVPLEREDEAIALNGIWSEPEEIPSIQSVSKLVGRESPFKKDTADSFRSQDMMEEQLYSDHTGSGGISQRMAGKLG